MLQPPVLSRIFLPLVSLIASLIGPALLTAQAEDLTLLPGTTSEIDANELGATFSDNIISEGAHQVDFGGSSLVKTGIGTLTFSGSSRVLETFAVTDGTVLQTAGATSAVEFMTGTGADKTGVYVMDGGTFTVGPSTKLVGGEVVAGSFRIGDFGGVGTFTQNAGEVTMLANTAFNIGNQGGTGTYELNGGTLTLNGGLHVLGRSAAGKPISHGMIELSGGLLHLTDGGSLINGNNLVGGEAGTGTINQTGGTLRVSAGGKFYLSGYSSAGAGAYNLDGGTLEIGGSGSLMGRYNNSASEYAFNLGGGTIKVIESELITSVDISLMPGTTSTIDTNDLGATFSGNITSAGEHQVDFGGSKLTKTGAGTLTLVSGIRTLDTFAVEGGTVRQESGTTTAVELMAGTANGNTGAYELTGGTLTIHSSTRADNVTVVGGSFRVGDFGGTGTFDQSGGTLNADSSLIIGNRAGTGVYNLSGGTLNVGASAPSGTSAIFVGRSRAGDGAALSTGTFNISGGTLNVAAGGFIVGGDTTPIADSGNAVGVVNQSGSSLVTVNTYVGLGMNGNGTYNLNGGTLELGGTNGLRRGGGTSAFNFGGGTLRVIGNTLTTSVAAAFGAGTISTIDTNGIGATWSGNLTGAGGLRKSGAGALTLSGAANSFGALLVEQGSTSVSTGATTVGQLLVGATGSGANGTFVMTGGTVSTTGNANSDFRTSYIGSGAGNTGTVVMSGGTLNVGLAATPGARADFEVGSFNGAGTMTQTGGDVVLNSTGGYFHIGNQGTGVYNLENGSITTLNAFALGRSTAAGIGDGTLNISGGSLTLATPSKSALIVGGVDGGHSARGGGNGVINQTGGTVSVAYYIELGTRGGHGVYNLDGGVLRIGGTNALRADTNTYSGVQGSYEFNLGGGTLQVMGSNLTSAVAMTLKNGTTSTVDTNGLGATFSGVLSGTGALTKVGDGTLTLSGASTFSGGTLVSDGTVLVSGSLVNSVVSVGDGATLSGHGSVAGVNVLAGGRFELGGTPGSFTITGDLTLAGTSRTLLYLAAGSNDRLAVGGTLFAGGVLEVGLVGDFDLLEGASFDLFDGTLNGAFANVLLPTLGSGLEWNLVDFGSGVISVMTASAIPEPSTWAAILGGMALLVAAWRRRGLRLSGVRQEA